MSTFTATCHVHELTFTGAEGAAELRAHLVDVHGRRPRSFPTAPKVKPPTPWKAPRPTKGGLEAVLERAAAGKYSPTSRVWDNNIGRYRDLAHDHLVSADI